MAAPEYLAALIIFICSIVGMLLCAVFKPTITFRIHRLLLTIETYFIFPLIGAIVILAAQIIPIKEAGKGLWSFAGLNPIGILILFFSMVYISKFLDTTGFFEFCALYSLSKSGGSARRLFFIIYGIVSILTIFTSNDVVVLTFTPFIDYFANAAGINPIPFLFGEFFAANTWSMIFIISNPTNVVLGSAFQQSFTDFAKVMVLTSFVGGMCNCLFLYLYFRKGINQSFHIEEEEVYEDPADKIPNKLDMIVGLVFTLGSIILMACSSIPGFNVEMWIIAGIMACVLLIYNIIIDIVRKYDGPSKLRIIFASLPYPIIFFLLSLFIIVNALKIKGFFVTIGNGLSSCVKTSKPLNVLIFGVISTLSANIFNNIPMSVAFVPIIQSTHSPPSKGAIYASVVGANLGANLSPLGALAGLMWLKILKEQVINIGFLDFMKVGFIITPITLLCTLGALMGMVEIT